MSIELQEWEAWAKNVKPGARCLVAGVPALVTAVTPEFLWARVEGQADPWEWEDVGPSRLDRVPAARSEVAR